MTETLWSATRAISRLIPGNIVVDGTATTTYTGSDYSKLADSAVWYVSPTTLPADDYYNGGTIWLDAMSSANLDNKSSIITDFTSTGGIFTYQTLGNYLTVTGDTYSAANRTYPRFILRQAVNWALSQVGGEDKQDVSLTTVADQMTYDLPTGVFNVKRLEIATSTTSPYGYVVIDPGKWREINDDISFKEGFQPTSTDYIIRLTYRVPFTELTTDYGVVHGTLDATCLIPDLVDMNWVRWEGVAYCLRWKLGLTKGNEEAARLFLKDSLEQAEKMAKMYKPKVQQMPMDWTHGSWAVQQNYTRLDDVDKVHL